MAARRVLRLAERQARAARPWPRPPQRIGELRESFGLSPSSSGPGPLRDLPDWSFSGEPTTPLIRPRPLPLYGATRAGQTGRGLGVIGLYWEGVGGANAALTPPTALRCKFM
ncbi:uncharacterized protein [Chamaea fasciata]|uniref:uncharacterized protein isoform X1 n=1 Tax=Chamaea fasciata TaxID=190680 RepID=UPI00336A8946